ncbi:MAG: ATP-dependent zinc metalloprotease FtsH, partial [Gemmatimonadota bacterium]
MLQKHHRFSLWYVIAAAVGLMALQILFVEPPVPELSYAQFQDRLKDGKVRQALIGQEFIRGTYVDEDGKDQGYSVRRVDDGDLVSRLEERDVEYRGVDESNWLMDLLTHWVLPFGLLFLVWGFLFRRMGAGGAMTFGKSKVKVYNELEATKVTFEDVAGIDEVEKELQEIIDFLKDPRKFQRLGGRLPKGVLLVGPPGTGKTLMARAVAGEAGVPFFSISGPEFVEMFVGVGAARVRDLFEQAKAKAPCVVFIDEIDAIGRGRGRGVMAGGHSEQEQTLNQLLVEMDGFSSEKGVIIMAATNRADVLDAALLRPGRFDRQILVDRPDLDGRIAILKVHTRGMPLGGDVDLRALGSQVPGMAGADLANICNEASLMAARRDQDVVGQADFQEAIERVVAGLERKSRRLNETEKRIVAYHEAGHALVGHFLTGTDVVQKISIVPRGLGALGYTMQAPLEDRYLMTTDELLDRIAGLLGGRAAEMVVFDRVSTGAQNDLERVSELARRMVCQFGMSERVGIVCHADSRQGNFLEDGLLGGRPFSEETARQVDAEVRAIIDGQLTRAR